jgi:hypothetical protein
MNLNYKMIIPLINLFPIAINLFNIYTQTKVRLKSQKFQFLQLNLFIDTLLFLSVIFQSISECEDICMKWLPNNYWLLMNKVYIHLFISYLLNTISTLLSLTNVWSRHQIMNTIKTPKNAFYLILAMNFFCSFIVYLPNVLMNEIVKIDNFSLDNNGTENYEINVKHLEYYRFIGISHFLISILIFMMNIILFTKLGIIIMKQLNFKENVETKDHESILHRRRESILLCKQLNDLNSEELDFITKRLSTNELEFKTTLLLFCLTIVFSVDLFFKALTVLLFIFIDRNSKQFFYLFIIIFSVIFLSQLSYAFLYFKFNKTYSNRIKCLFSALKSKKKLFE